MCYRTFFPIKLPGALISLGLLLQAQTWTTLTNTPPAGVSACMLLTDGGVMCQSEANWFKFTPDFEGSYLNGTWSSLASLPSSYEPTYYGSAVLADGRVLIVGGEYNNGAFALTNMSAVYDPAGDSWQMVSPPAFSDFQCMGDTPAAVLPNGDFLAGAKLFTGELSGTPSTQESGDLISFTVTSSSATQSASVVLSLTIEAGSGNGQLP